MLETPQERVRLLKAGIDGRTIEKLYLIYNDFKIINIPILFVGFDDYETFILPCVCNNIYTMRL